MRTHVRTRIYALMALVVCVMVVYMGRLAMLQIWQGDAWRARAEAQYVSESRELYDRGSIFFQSKDGTLVAAAGLEQGYFLAIHPNRLVDPARAFDALSALVPIEREDFFARAEKKDDPYEEIAHRLSEEEATQIRALDIPGVSVFRERWRNYPGGTLGAHLLGFVGFEGDARVGRYGLERYFESTLERNKKNLDVNFFAEIFSTLHSVVFDGTSALAGDVVTSIEPNVAIALEKELEEAQARWRAKSAGGIVMDPKTGKIYALALRPTFDPNNFQTEKDISVFANPLVEDRMEMGSIMKPITMAIGLDEQAVSPSTVYHDYGFLELDGYTIKNYDGRGRGDVPMQEILSQSLNTGVAFIASRVGKETFGTRLGAFGFGEETGIDLPHEARGDIANLKSPRMLEYATASFGQGIAVTPIAMTRALAALANGGTLVTPHLAERVEGPSGFSRHITYDTGARVLGEEAARATTRMLVTVVDTALAQGKEKREHYSIAAKTGTAQIAKEGARGYYSDRYLHTFFGYFPAYDPRFIIFLYIREPRAEYASETLTKPFMNLTDYLINYYEIPPDR